MLRWLWNTLWTVGWYIILLSGWYCWARARWKVAQLEIHLTRLVHALRQARRKEDPYV